MSQSAHQGFDFGCGVGCGFLCALIGIPIIAFVILVGIASEMADRAPTVPATRRPSARRQREPSAEKPMLETEAGMRGRLVEIDGEDVTLRLASGEITTVEREWLTAESRHALDGL